MRFEVLPMLEYGSAVRISIEIHELCRMHNVWCEFKVRHKLLFMYLYKRSEHGIFKMLRK